MKCLYPITVNPGRGKFTVYSRSDGSLYSQEHVVVPCGQCIACRLNYGKLWSMRMMEELKKHETAAFVTLTYNNDSLPFGNKLCKEDLQRFFKRLRKRTSVRYFSCGEYGDSFGRPHYHAIIYGISPNDVDLVERCWCAPIKNKYRRHRYEGSFIDVDGKAYRPLGNVKLGTVTPDSCAYVAKYMTKKLRGKSLAEQLEKDPDYQNEFVLMSRRPGIGGEPSPEMVKFMKENGFMYRKDKRSALPRYYKDKYDIHGASCVVNKDEFDCHLTNFDKNDRVIRKRLNFFGRKS